MIVAIIPGISTRVAAVGKVHRQLALDHLERLILIVAVHLVHLIGLVVVHPRVEAAGVQHHGAPLRLMSERFGVDDLR